MVSQINFLDEKDEDQDVVASPFLSTAAPSSCHPSPIVTPSDQGAENVIGLTPIVNSAIFDDKPNSTRESEQNGLPFCGDIISELQELQNELRDRKISYTKELHSLERKYDKIYKDIFQRRASVLEKETYENNPEQIVIQLSPSKTTSIPDFWLNAMKNHQILRLIVENADEPVLTYLKDVTTEWVEENSKSSFRLCFYFYNNPYFKETLLVKQYNLEFDDEMKSDILVSTKSSKPSWFDGKDVTTLVATTSQTNIRSGAERYVTTHNSQKSFFNIFRETHFPTMSELESLSDEELKVLQANLASDLEAGISFRDNLIPDAIDWYMGRLKVVIPDYQSTISEENKLENDEEYSLWDFIF